MNRKTRQFSNRGDMTSALRCLPLLGLMGLVACGSSGGSGGDDDDSGETGVGVCGDDTDTMVRPTSWTKESHCPGVEANYDEVFDASRVRRLDLSIDPAVFAQAEADLEAIADQATTQDLDSLPNPMWMSATLTYTSKAGVTQSWSQVGVRWKGHASLAGAWSNRIRKFSMKLRFDEFEDSFPELTDQRFFGFKGFSLGNAYKDDSFIRDKTAADIFRAAGVPAPRGSFAQVYVDIGKGPFYLGMFTIIEEPDDHMLQAQLGDDSGNLYKPWGDPARWPAIAETATTGLTTTAADIQTYFEKSTNGETSDWSDIIAAINALHADRTDAAAWRTNLEAVFDVKSFLKTLAVNQVMVNWDSYGCMPHNYLVYANPADGGRFRWLPWDLNEALSVREHAGCVPSSVMLDEIVHRTDPAIPQWPLIEFLLGDETYRTSYRQELQATLDTAFSVDALKASMQADHDLIAPYLDGTIAQENGSISAEEGGLFASKGRYQNSNLEDFQASLSDADPSDGSVGLFAHVESRVAAVTAALAAP